jgi:hypothetical protein
MKLTLTIVGLHEHVVVLETVNLANEGDWAANKIHDLRNPDKGMGLSMHCLYLFCHYKFYI